MVLAYHVIFTMYGFWLPNDPRGSWSDFVRAWELLKFGAATKTATRRSVADRVHDQHLRRAAKEALNYPPVQLTGEQVLSAAMGFAFATSHSGYKVYACSVMPDHVHMVIGRHSYRAEQIVRRLKEAATLRLTDEHLHPLAACRTPDDRTPSPWARKCWKVFLDNEPGIVRAISYVEDNPSKEGKRRQRWSFVTPFRASNV